MINHCLKRVLNTRRPGVRLREKLSSPSMRSDITTTTILLLTLCINTILTTIANSFSSFALSFLLAAIVDVICIPLFIYSLYLFIQLIQLKLSSHIISWMSTSTLLMYSVYILRTLYCSTVRSFCTYIVLQYSVIQFERTFFVLTTSYIN